jgi:predicted RNA-binding Zn ribbon-like protein
MAGEVPTAAVLLGEPLPVELINTVGMDRDGVVRDALESDAGVQAWLRAVASRIEDETGIGFGAPGGDEVPAVAAQLRAVRDALRRLAVEVTADPRILPAVAAPTRTEAVATLNAHATAWPELAWPAGGRPRQVIRVAGPPLEFAVRAIAHQGVEFFAGDRRDRLRACLAPNCLLFFLKEHSRREWCSPGCGNRARVARHYRRHRAGGSTDEK